MEGQQDRGVCYTAQPSDCRLLMTGPIMKAAAPAASPGSGSLSSLAVQASGSPVLLSPKWSTIPC
jgi:hypothetical protein